MGMNAHRVFHRDGADNTYHAALDIGDTDRIEMRAARDAVRAALQEGFRTWQDHISRQELLEHAALLKSEFAGTPALKPKFKMQGSWAYHTLNRTTQEPPQEIDLDDGVFLPVSFLSQNGRAHPAVVSSAYFKAVEAMVAPVCAEQGWTLAEPKSSCVRIKLRPGAHLDLALYAIPDDEFETIMENADAILDFSGQIDEQSVFRANVYPRLPSNHIMLAHREEGWKPSDPRKLQTWFEAAIAEHGQQLRRVCRYLKAWRDHHWDQCRLSSITLMASAVSTYDRLHRRFDDARDDKAMLFVAEELVTHLGGAIKNPVVPGQFLDEGWSLESRGDFVSKARTLVAELRSALDDTQRSRASARLCAIFGTYLPDDPDLLVVEGAPSILTTGMLRELADEPEAQQAVKLGGDNRFG